MRPTLRHCEACADPLDATATTGRPRQYCDAACRQRAHRQRARHRREQLSNRDNWWTPEPLRQELRQRWHITLDAAASLESRVVPRYLGPDHPDPALRDALAVEWSDQAAGGVVYVNPPYRPRLLRLFLARAAATASQGTPVVALIPAATSTQWWAQHITGTGACADFLTGRLRFDGPHSTGGPAPFASALVEWLA